MARNRLPAPTSILVGREAELQRLREAMDRVPVASICGIAGIGKSTVAYTLALQWPGRCVYSLVLSAGNLAGLLDDARRQLGGASWPLDAPLDERVADLAEDLNTAGALWVLDDLHRLDVGAQLGLIDGLGRWLRQGRVLTTSREMLPRSGGAPDRSEVRLAGLTESEARDLWVHLDGLYGPAGGFELAWKSSRGNPFLLRRAHAGGLYDEDPIPQAVADLDPSDRRLAEALALSQVPLPRQLLATLLPEQEALPALRRLVTGLIVDIDGTGSCTVHDVYRETLLAQMAPEAGIEMHKTLADRLRDAEIDPVGRVLEVTRHLRALKLFTEASTYLLQEAPTLTRHGASGELLRCLEAIPLAQRSPMHRVAQAQARCRLLDLRGGFAELEQLMAANVEPRSSIRLTFAKIAMSTGRLALSQRVLTQLVEAADTPDDLRQRARIFVALCRTHQGFGEEARRTLMAEMAEVYAPHYHPLVHFTISYTYWLEERDDQAEAPMRLAQAMLADRLPTLHADATAPAFWAGLLARLGRFQESEEALRAAESALRRYEDLRMLTNVRATRAGLLYEQGHRAAALQEFESVRKVYERGGDRLGVLWTQAWIGRLLLLMGRRREGFSVLDVAQRVAEEASAGSLVAMVRRSRGFDILEMLARRERPPLPASDRRGALVRQQVLHAIDEARAGREAAMRAQLTAHERLTFGADYAFDRALGAIADALLCRATGDAAAAASALAAARREVDVGEFDPDIIPMLIQRLGEVRVVMDRDLPDANGNVDRTAEHDVVLDGRNHELRTHGAVRAYLARKGIVRRLFYALARDPGRCFRKDELVGAVWGTVYAPSVHDKPLRVNISRLRSLVHDSGLRVEAADEGYALKVPPGFVFVEPFSR